MPVQESVSHVVLLIGLAVGVDYSLFYLRREREERAAGRGERAALEAAAATSGRAVLISGITVLIAMAGMFFSGDKAFMSFSIGTMMVVAVAMIGSLTVLPALLSKLGDRVEKGRIPFVGRLRRNDGESRVWGAVLDRVLRRPVVSVVAATAVLLALAAPALVLNTTTTTIERHLDPGDRAGQEAREGLPGRQRPGVDRDRGQGRHRRARRERDRRPPAQGAGERPDGQPDGRRDQRRRHRRRGLRSPSRAAPRTKCPTPRSTPFATSCCRRPSARSTASSTR